MNLSRPDFFMLKREIVIFIFLLGIGIVAVMASRIFVAQARSEYLEERQKMNEARSRLGLALADIKDGKTFSAEYNELLRLNIIGNDRHSDWAEGLEKIRSRNLVIDFRYSIFPPQPFSPHPAENGSYDLHLSRMSIRLDLLHEGQLLAFLEALLNESNGWFILDHCSIERVNAKPANQPDSSAPETNDNGNIQRRLANLHAECSGGWLTMKLRSTP